MNTLLFVPSRVKRSRAEYFQHLYPALKGKSQKFVYMNPIERGYKSLEETHLRVMKFVEESKIDMFFAMTGGDFISPDTIEELRSKGILTINFSTDNLDRPKSLEQISKYFDFVWVSEPEAVSIMRDFSANPINLPMAADPEIFRPRQLSERYDAAFCGSKISSRPEYIYKLLETCPGKFFIAGSGWLNSDSSAYDRSVRDPLYTLRYILENLSTAEGRKNVTADLIHILRESQPSPTALIRLQQSVHNSLSFRKYVELYSLAKVSLGFNERGNTYLLKHPIVHHRLRDFEAPMSGACYLMLRLPDMQNCFDEDKEMLFYSSFGELCEKITYYSRPENDSLRLRIRQRARTRALRQHTWTHRLNKLFEIIHFNK